MAREALEWMSRFDEHLRLERRVSPHTVAGYRRDVRALAAFCAAQGVCDWAGLDARHVRAFLAARHRAGLRGRSLQRTLSAVRTFYSYLLREGAAVRN
ncbi:MAG: site-specific integrase, partial [Gammaproteobacteria bacterium]|nr:site-specific integrase [Gammaproteobacteria bacterium]